MWLAHAYTICLKTINLQPNGGLPSDSIPFHESTRPKCMDRLVGACIPVSQPRRWCCKPKAACLRSSRTNKRDPFEGAVRMSGCKRPFFRADLDLWRSHVPREMSLVHPGVCWSHQSFIDCLIIVDTTWDGSGKVWAMTATIHRPLKGRNLDVCYSCCATLALAPFKGSVKDQLSTHIFFTTLDSLLPYVSPYQWLRSNYPRTMVSSMRP